jgi:hypothetical protein
MMAAKRIEARVQGLGFRVQQGSGEAGVEEEFAVAFHAKDGGIDEGKGFTAMFAD